MRQHVRPTAQPVQARPVRVRRRPKVRVSRVPQKVQAQAQPAAAHEDTPQVIFVHRAAVSVVTSDHREIIIGTGCI